MNRFLLVSALLFSTLPLHASGEDTSACHGRDYAQVIGTVTQREIRESKCLVTLRIQVLNLHNFCPLNRVNLDDTVVVETSDSYSPTECQSIPASIGGVLSYSAKPDSRGVLEIERF